MPSTRTRYDQNYEGVRPSGLLLACHDDQTLQSIQCSFITSSSTKRCRTFTLNEEFRGLSSVSLVSGAIYGSIGELKAEEQETLIMTMTHENRIFTCTCHIVNCILYIIKWYSISNCV